MIPVVEEQVNTIVGWDLAQSTDYSAVVGMTVRSDPHTFVQHYDVTVAVRLPHGMSYPRQIKWVKLLMTQPAFANGTLCIDQTGLGKPVVDSAREAAMTCTIVPVSITPGNEAKYFPDKGEWHVPKKDLAGVLQIVSEQRRLSIGPTSPERPDAETLRSELGIFRMKQSKESGHMKYEAALGSGNHDDLVVSLAIALFVAEHQPIGWSGNIGIGPGMKHGPEDMWNDSSLPRPW